MYKYILAILLSINHLIALTDINITVKRIDNDSFLTVRIMRIMSELDSSNSVQKDLDCEEEIDISIVLLINKNKITIKYWKNRLNDFNQFLF